MMLRGKPWTHLLSDALGAMMENDAVTRADDKTWLPTGERPITLPAAFWGQLTEEQQARLERLDADGMILFPTGSRAICPDSASPDSDIDVYFLANEPYGMRMMADHGWKGPSATGEATGTRTTKSGSDILNSMSMRHGNLNAIVFFARAPFERFKLASEFCIELGGPTTREKRIEVFRKIAKGEDP